MVQLPRCLALLGDQRPAVLPLTRYAEGQFFRKHTDASFINEKCGRPS